MAKKYIVSLTPEEREGVVSLTKKGKTGARKINRDHILLMADEGWADMEIAEVLRTGKSAVQRIRRRFIEGGPERTLNEEPRSGASGIPDGRGRHF